MIKQPIKYLDKYQELLDNELMNSGAENRYEVFGKKSDDNKWPKDGWQYVGVKTLDEIKELVLKYDPDKRVLPRDVNEFIYYMIPPKNDSKEYLHLKVRSKNDKQ